MLKFRKFKRARQGFPFFLILILGILIFLSTILILANLKISRKREELDLEKETLKNKIESLKKERENLESKIFQAESEDFIEKTAREELNLKKEEEKVVAFPILKEGEEEPESEEEKNFLQKFLEKINIK